MNTLKIVVAIHFLLLCRINTHLPNNNLKNNLQCDKATIKDHTEFLIELIDKENWTFKYALQNCDNLPDIEHLNRKIGRLVRVGTSSEYVQKGDQCYLKIILPTKNYKKAYRFMKKLRKTLESDTKLTFKPQSESAWNKVKYFYLLCEEAESGDPDIMGIKKIFNSQKKLKYSRKPSKYLSRYLAKIHKTQSDTLFRFSVGPDKTIRLRVPLAADNHFDIFGTPAFANHSKQQIKRAIKFYRHLLKIQTDHHEFDPHYHKIQNYSSLDSITENTLHWKEYFKEIFKDIPFKFEGKHIDVASVPYLKILAKLIKNTPRETLVTYLEYAFTFNLLRTSRNCITQMKTLFPHVVQETVWRKVQVRKMSLQPKAIFDDVADKIRSEFGLEESDDFAQVVGQYTAAQDLDNGSRLDDLYSQFLPRKHFGRTARSALEVQWRRLMSAAFVKNKLIFRDDGYSLSENLQFPRLLSVEEGMDEWELVKSFVFAFSREIFHKTNEILLMDRSFVQKTYAFYDGFAGVTHAKWIPGHEHKISYLVFHSVMEDYRKREDLQNIFPIVGEGYGYRKELCLLLK